MKKFVLSLAGALAVSASAVAAVPQTHVYRNDGRFHKIEGDITVSHRLAGQAGVVSFQDRGETVDLPLSQLESFEIASVDIPRLIINTPESPDLWQIVEKETYLAATIEVEGNGYLDDAAAAEVNIKGRGNSTWGMPKKPIRLKFAKKTPFCGLKKAKSFVLLANYIDPTLMRNAVAMKTAQLLGMAYANHIVPCNITFNGHDLGSFMLTEKVGINAGSVDIDETKGMLFELSDDFDEKYRFHSPVYNLPVMVKDPDLDEISADDPALGTADEMFSAWRDDFNRAERLVSQGRGFEAFDLDSFVDYVLLYNLCCNSEIGHPKSLYVHKEELGEGCLYKTGPAWDFDMAFNITNLVGGQLVQRDADTGLWVNRLFEKLIATPGFMERYRERLQTYRDELFPQLIEYFDGYASLLRSSAKVNGQLWPGGDDYGWIYVVNSFGHEAEVAALRQWLHDRLAHLETAAARGSIN